MEFIAEQLLCMCNILLPNTKIFLSLNIFFPIDVHCAFICHFEKMLIGFPLGFVCLFLLVMLLKV